MQTTDMLSEREEDSGNESSAATDNSVYIRISVPELKLQKCLQFSSEDNVWVAKQRVLSTLARDLKDGLNYGLYCPPINGKAGKFLDEERPLQDYPLPGPIGFLEFKYKRRVYKQMQINPKKLKQLHTRANLKQFIEYVRKNDIERVVKYCNKGLDPNFHDHDSGEVPLTMASTLERSRQMIITLVSGGAHVDYRSRDGLTPMHKAALKGNQDAIKILLDLGASPNYKDGKGLTPLYLACMQSTSAHCIQMLLHDHALLGTTDEYDWTEVHHACRAGRVQHLEHLLFYGAELNSQNSTGNTPLHVCAVNNQESCARVLLFRGADKAIQNYSNQDAFQVAIISGNTELAAIIRDFNTNDVVPYQELPKYNDKRRGTISAGTLMSRSRSNPSLNQLFNHTNGSKPGSPNISHRSIPRYLSNGSLDSVGRHDYDSDSPRSMSISSTGSYGAGSDYIHAPPVPPKHFGRLPRAYSTDMIDMLSVGEQGYWEGKVGNKEGWFPSDCVQEIHMRKHKKGNTTNEDVVVKKETLAALVSDGDVGTPRTVVLQKGKGGFGFVLRGAKSQHAAGSKLEFTPTRDFPALQYLDRVDKNSPADKAGLKPGDFLLEINRENVINATHEHTVRLIKNSGTTLAMKVITVKPTEGGGHELHADGTRTLPTRKKGAPPPPTRNPYTSLTPSVTNRVKYTFEGLSELEKLDSALDQYENEDVNKYSTMATAKGVDPDNKTASIRSRNAMKRLTSVPLDTIFTTENGIDDDIDRSASNQPKPVVHVPGSYRTMPNTKMGERARSTPSLVQNNGTNHVADIDINEQNGRATNIRLSNVPANDRVIYGNDDRIYAVPFGNQGRTQSSTQINHEYMDPNLDVRFSGTKGKAPNPPGSGPIPPPPNHTPPRPPERANGEVITIQTNNHYANVADDIRKRHGSSSDTDKDTDRDSLYESSFRPGMGARMTKEPLGAPASRQVTPPGSVHSRQSSMSSTVSSMSAQSDQKNHYSHLNNNIHKSRVESVQIHSTPKSQYYEPEPDYDMNEPSSPHPNDLELTTKVPPPPPSSKPPPTPKSPKAEENSMSAFGNAIKAAAIEREKRSKLTPPVQRVENKPPPPTSNTSVPPPPPQSGGPPPPPSGGPPPPPPPPPPGTLSALSTPRSTPDRDETDSVKPMPNDVKKKLDEGRQRNASHAALMAAVQKRRNIVDSADMSNVAESIEDRVNRSRKLQTTVYKSDKTKTEIKSIDKVQSMPLLSSLRETKQNNRPALPDTKTIEANGGVANKRQAPAPPPNTAEKPKPTDNTMDLLAEAEKARQEYIQKKQATIDRRQSNSPRKAPDVNTSKSSLNDSNSGNMGDFASLIALKAAKRQQSYENLENNNNNNTRVYRSPATAQDSPVFNRGPSKIDIMGATVDYSLTDPPTLGRSSNKPRSSSTDSVLSRTKLFEKSNAGRNNSPTPMVPPPVSFGHSSHSTRPTDSDSAFIPPPPVFDMNDHSGSVHSSATTVSSSGNDMYVVNPPPHIDIVNPAVAPPPPGFDDDDIPPPPANFSTSPARSPATSLRSVIKSPNSMTFPAKTVPSNNSNSKVDFQNKALNAWTVDDVSGWLESLNLSEHCAKFKQQRVDGQKLPQLGRDELIKLGVSLVGHRMNIERGIKKAAAANKS